MAAPGTAAAGTAAPGTAVADTAAPGTAVAVGAAVADTAADTAAADTDESVIVTERSPGTHATDMHSLQFPDGFAAEKSLGSRCLDHHIIKIHSY
jgi:hypothetical protein